MPQSSAKQLHSFCRLAAGEEVLHRSASTKEAEAAPGLAQDMMQTLLDNLSNAGADAAEGRARRILLGLGFASGQMDSPVSRLSGHPNNFSRVISDDTMSGPFCQFEDLDKACNMLVS